MGQDSGHGYMEWVRFIMEGAACAARGVPLAQCAHKLW